MRNKILNRVRAVILLFFCSLPVQTFASLIEVSQESGVGAGDFDANVLGMIDSFQTGLTMAGFYQYNVPNGASYNGDLNGGPTPISSLTQSFFVDAADGLHYVVVHDAPNDGSGLSTRMTTIQVGGAGGITVFSVEDDPAEGTAISDVGADRRFDTVHNAVACCTDGWAIGDLMSTSILYAQFDISPTGITSWQASSNSLADIALVIDPERRVRFELINDVPVPAPLMLIGIGLASLGLSRRSSR